MKTKKYLIDWECFGLSQAIVLVVVAGLSCIGGMFLGAEIVYNAFM